MICNTCAHKQVCKIHTDLLELQKRYNGAINIKEFNCLYSENSNEEIVQPLKPKMSLQERAEKIRSLSKDDITQDQRVDGFNIVLEEECTDCHKDLPFIEQHEIDGQYYCEECYRKKMTTNGSN